jgi:hypothetical protein
VAVPTVLLTLAFFLAIVLGLVVWVQLTGRRLKGSCGGPQCHCVTEGNDLGSCEAQGPSDLPVLRG